MSTPKRKASTAPKARPLRLSPELAQGLDQWAAELSVGTLGRVSRAALARAALAWALTERPKASDLSAALALVEGAEGAAPSLRLAPAA